GCIDGCRRSIRKVVRGLLLPTAIAWSALSKCGSSAAGPFPSGNRRPQRQRSQLTAALDQRVEEMYASGLVEETKRLLAVYSRSARPFGAIGYREAAA